MNRGLACAAALLLLAWQSSGCSAPGAAEGKRGGKETGKPPVAVEASRAAEAELAEGVSVVGALSPKFQSEVKSEVGGSVAEVYVTEWVRVKKGAPLARLDTREAEALRKRAEASVEMARAGLLEAQAAANRAARELERAQKLKESGLVTQQSLDDALTQRDAAAARVAAAKAQVSAAEEDVRQSSTRISKAVIRAPFDGIVAERSVNVGEVVGEMQKVVFRIVDPRLLDLTVSVPSGEMAAVRPGQEIAFSTDAIPGRAFAGKVRFVNPVVSEADRSIRVVAEVRNPTEELKGGMFVKGRIVTGRRKGVLLAPRSALVVWDVAAKKGEVLVMDKDVARLRPVRCGSVSGDFVEIVSGLSKGEEVITRGGFNVKDGDRVNVTRVNGGK
jgi:RND family efflux transporter MFP subunit